MVWRRGAVRVSSSRGIFVPSFVVALRPTISLMQCASLAERCPRHRPDRAKFWILTVPSVGPIVWYAPCRSCSFFSAVYFDFFFARIQRYYFFSRRTRIAFAVHSFRAGRDRSWTNTDPSKFFSVLPFWRFRPWCVGGWISSVALASVADPVS